MGRDDVLIAAHDAYEQVSRSSKNRLHEVSRRGHDLREIRIGSRYYVRLNRSSTVLFAREVAEADVQEISGTIGPRPP